MASLSDRQWAHAQRLAKLIEFCSREDYKITLKCGYCLEEHHSTNSYHKRGLAQDLALFLPTTDQLMRGYGGYRYARSTEAYTPLGEYWESIGGTWGGRFRKLDGNHFSSGERWR